MKLSRIAQSITFENKVFIFLLVAVTLAFVWVLWPFYGAVFWGAIFAMMFQPLFLRLLKTIPNRRTLAALGTLAIILVVQFFVSIALSGQQPGEMSFNFLAKTLLVSQLACFFALFGAHPPAPRAIHGSRSRARLRAR